MRYATATAFRQALEARLKTEAQSSGLPLARLRKGVAFELLLRRLVAVAPDRWVLKGALALDYRFGAQARPTKDVDLGREDDEESAVADLIAAQQLQLDDFFSFAVSSLNDIGPEDEFAAIRFHVAAELAGRTFEQFTIDVGFSDPLDFEPDRVSSSGLLEFAGIEPVSVPTLPVTRHLSEKVHACTRTYGDGDDTRASTRPKDLVDILLIGAAEMLDGSELRMALERTFSERDQHPLPDRLPEPPAGWRAPYAALAEDVGVEAELGPAHARAAKLLDPVLDGSAAGKRWIPDPGYWADPNL